MSTRVQVTQSFIDRIKNELNGSSNKYYTNIGKRISRKIYKFDQIHEFPYIGVQQGPETYKYMPSLQKFNYLSLSIFVYDKKVNDIQEQLEKIIADLQTIIDSERNITYTITKADGSEVKCETIDISMVSTSTDEGILDPFGLAEIQVVIQYQTYERNL